MENTRLIEHMTQVSFRIPITLKELVEKIVSQDCHINSSEFFREALREKIKEDAPHLYKQLFEKEVTKE